MLRALRALRPAMLWMPRMQRRNPQPPLLLPPNRLPSPWTLLAQLLLPLVVLALLLLALRIQLPVPFWVV